MLTCIVGKEEIHSFEYDYEQLKKWSNKKLLKCPQCNDTLIYRHGKIKIPHFAHEHLECSNIYQEQDTLEHMEGKIALYKWVKEIDGVSNVSVEKYIPETKQIADIYFEYNDEKYVIEYQCSPISSEFLERKELYRLNGIKDIWILGNEKYLKNTTVDGGFKTKEIERQLLFSNSQKLCYANEQGIKIIKDYKPLLDKKTTFNFVFRDNSYKDLILDDILLIPNKNEDKIINWFNLNLKNISTEIQYGNEIEIRDIIDEKIIKVKPIVSFNLSGIIYFIIYNNGYVNTKDYKYIKKKFSEKNIKILYFTNYDTYKNFFTSIKNKCKKEYIKINYMSAGMNSEMIFVNNESLIYNENNNFLRYFDYLNRYNEFKYHLKNIFDNNKDLVLEYEMNYNYEEYKNLIFFKTHKDEDYIIYFPSLNMSFEEFIEENIYARNEKRIYEKKLKTIPIDLDGYNYKKKFLFEEKYSNVLVFGNIYNSSFAVKYSNPYDKKINLSYKPYENKYFNINRFNFDEKNNELDELIEYKNNLKNKSLENINLDNKKIYTAEDMTLEIKNKELDGKIKKCLYPIIYQMENNDLEEYNFRLNYEFCNKKPWIIKDFIEKLRELGFNNITNVI